MGKLYNYGYVWPATRTVVSSSKYFIHSNISELCPVIPKVISVNTCVYTYTCIHMVVSENVGSPNPWVSIPKWFHYSWFAEPPLVEGNLWDDPPPRGKSLQAFVRSASHFWTKGPEGWFGPLWSLVFWTKGASKTGYHWLKYSQL